MKEKVMDAIITELRYQQLKSVRENWKKDKTAIEYTVLMEAEIEEAKQGYCKNDMSNFGRNTTEHEILQTVCLGLEFLSNMPEAELDVLINSTIAKMKHEFNVEGGNSNGTQ